MTVEMCRQLALENNKAVAIATRAKEQAQYSQKSLRANYLPKVSVSGNYFVTNAKMNSTIDGGYLPTFVPDPATGNLVPNIAGVNPDGSYIFKEYAYFPGMDFSLKPSGTWTAGVTAEQPLYLGGKIATAHKMSKIGSQIADENQELTRVRIIVETDEAYWTYVQTSELLVLALSYQKVVAELLRNVEDAYSVGLKHQNDVLKVRVKANEAELKVRQAENGLRLSRKNLCRVMGVPLDSEILLPGSISDRVVVAVDRTADFTTRPEYVMLDKQIELKEEQIKLTQSDFLPQVGVRANYGYMNGVKLNGDKLFNDASFSALATVNIPLFQWGEGRNKMRSAQTERDIIRLQRDDAAQMMNLELIRTMDKCEESELEVKLTSESLLQAEENMKMSGDQYEAGMETLVNYLEAQTVWQRAWMDNITAKTNQRLNQTYYLKAAGKL
jgi:outer membrane protein TolC